MNKDHEEQLEINEVSQKNKYKSIIESLLFMSGEPINIKDLATILNCKQDKVSSLLNEMKNSYVGKDRGIKILIHNRAVQLVTKPENSIYVEKLLKTNVRQSLSQAALETLSIIAYKQPITRVAIDEIRGVKSDRAIYTLLEKNIIKECGRLDVPGKPILYGTTEEFLKFFGLDSIEAIPNLEDLLKEFSKEEN
ncbi:segregation/condensation protein B [Clostridium botulinum]|uniref:Segregation and condensation protein B n=2 Tax=Clostridium botulinum TaxID=1491 RepID=SCPB_CLOB6|nr:SMC-Scp complex subunit ScpB [Clostridium botulinum]C3KX86.1 RecName: Full=Segregation and condensation protein B [Clostridium botulinum Ba4 str. 657]AJD25457.1 segregation and condensation protein B [Clostridium botulinum CDC_297]ACQ53110.1 segregation and condensation protein B [Clostridium botulinum Ba4 str. 657]AJE11765.1 segregation and condensation protein B [Clostridium botulinum CDC_1436]APR01159.1 segregation and condensation protein B [Clostridium botulinum]APU60701.1 segregation